MIALTGPMLALGVHRPLGTVQNKITLTHEKKSL